MSKYVDNHDDTPEIQDEIQDDTPENQSDTLETQDDTPEIQDPKSPANYYTLHYVHIFVPS